MLAVQLECLVPPEHTFVASKCSQRQRLHGASAQLLCLVAQTSLLCIVNFMSDPVACFKL